MSRKTPTKELRVDDLVETTIRRSSRISNNSPVPSQIITRRTSNTSEASTASKSIPVYDPEIGSKRVTRNSLSKSEDDIKPKARRASISKIKEEEEDLLTPSRRRSTRASSSSPTSKKHLEPIVATPGRRTRRSLSANLAEDPVEITKAATRGRKNSSNEPESATTKPSKSVTDTEEQDENKKPIVQKLKEPKISTPIKSKRRGSITEPANLEAIAEQDTENLDTTREEVIVNSQKKVLLRKGKLDEKAPLDLSIIAEKSYSEEIDNEDVESTEVDDITNKENRKTVDKEIIVGSSSTKTNNRSTDTEKISGDIERDTIINVSPSEKESNAASGKNLAGSKDIEVPKLTSAKSSIISEDHGESVEQHSPESSTAGKLIVDSVAADKLDSSLTKVALTNGILSEHAGEVTSSNTDDDSIIEPESKLRKAAPKAIAKPVSDKLEINREPNKNPTKIASTEEATVSPKQSVVCEKDRNNVSIGSDGSFEMHLEDSFSVTRNNPDVFESSVDEITSPSSDKENKGTPLVSDTNVPRLSVGKTKSDNSKDPINTQSNILTEQKKSLNISSKVENVLDSSKYAKGLNTSSKDDKMMVEDEILTDRRKSYSFYEPMEVDESTLNVSVTSRKSLLINNPNPDDIEESTEDVLRATSTSNTKLTDSEEEFYLLSDTENAEVSRKLSLKDVSKEKSLDEISAKTSVGEIAKESSPSKSECKQEVMKTLIESKGSPISTQVAKMASNELITAPVEISAQTPDSKKSSVCSNTSSLTVRRSPRISITPTKNVASIEKNENKEKTKTSDNITPSKNDGEKFILKVKTPMRGRLSSPSQTSSEKTPRRESGGARKTMAKGNESPRNLNASTKDQEASNESDEDSVVEVTDGDSETQDIDDAKIVTKKADNITPSKSDGEKFILKVKTPIRGKLCSPRQTSPEKEPRRDSEGARKTIAEGNKSPRYLNVSTKDQEVSDQSDDGSVVEVLNEDSETEDVDHGNIEIKKDGLQAQGDGTSSDTGNENESPEEVTDLGKEENQSKQNDVQGNAITKTSNTPNRKMEAKNRNSVERTKGVSSITGVPDHEEERADNEIQPRTPVGRKVEERISKTSPRKYITVTAATLHDIQTDMNLDSSKSPEYTKNKKKSLTIPSPHKFNAKADKIKTSTINYMNSTSEKRAPSEKLNVKLDKDVDSKLDDLLLKSISKRGKDGNESSDDSDEEVHKSDNLETRDLLAHNFGSTSEDEDYVPEEHHDTGDTSEYAEDSLKITDLLTKTIGSSSDDEDFVPEDGDVSEPVYEFDSCPNTSDDQDETNTKAGKPSRVINESSDEDEDANARHPFVDDMAEEEEEDTPSEGSNDIIEEGESINTTESEVESDESYDKDDSFLDDSEVFELLSGEEDFLENDIAEEKATKVDVKKKKSKGKTRIIRIEDSSDDEEPTTECEETKSQKISESPSQNVSESPNSKIPSIEISEDTENKNQDHASPYKSSRRGSFVCPPPVNPEITSTPNASLMDILNNSRKSSSRSSSIMVQENVNIDEIKDGVLIEKLQQVVQIFCSGIKSKGNLSLNVSLDYKEKSPNRDGSLKDQSFSTTVQDDEDDVVFVENEETVTDKIKEQVRMSPQQLNLSGSSEKLKGKGKRSVENLKESPVFKKDDNKISQILSKSAKSPKLNEKRKHTEADDEPISAKRHSPEKLNTKQNLSGLKSADQDNANLMNVSNRSKKEERRKSKLNKEKYADEQVQPEKRSPEKLNRKNIESDVERAEQINKAITVVGHKNQDGGSYIRAESAFQRYLQEKKSDEVITKPKKTPDTKRSKPGRSTYNTEVENVASTETDQESGAKVESNNETSIKENSVLKIKKKRRRKSKYSGSEEQREVFKVDSKRRKIEVPTQRNASESTWALSDRQVENNSEVIEKKGKAKNEYKKSKIIAQFKPRLHKLLQATVIDVKNRSRRTIKPSRGSDSPDSWSTESIIIMPSTANVGKINEPKVAFNTEKLDPKDFKNLMCFNIERVQRVETKKLLKKKGNFF